MAVNMFNQPATRLVRGDAGGDYYNPNAGISPELQEHAASFSLSFFNRLRLQPRHILRDGAEQPGFMYVEVGDTAHLVYVRVTLNDEQEVGTGPIPGILIDRAREQDAQPHVVRIHFREVENGVGIEYFGHDELERELRAGDWWRRQLLHRRTARDYLRLVGGGTSTVEVLVRHDPPGMRQPEPMEPAMQEIFGKPDDTPYFFVGSVELGLRMDPDPRTRLNCIISICRLLESTHHHDEFYIFTCSCGTPMCSDIWAGVDVAHEDGLLVWRMRGNKPRRVLVFDHDQYRHEIFTKVRSVLALHKAMGPAALIGAGESRERIEAALFAAEDAAA